MREITVTKKMKVIRLFFSGLSYDGIAQQVGIAKGSVVYTINDFREGDLPVPPDMTEYVDTLRQLAVDLRKNNTSVARVQSCVKLDAKLREMGVACEQAEMWLDSFGVKTLFIDPGSPWGNRYIESFNGKLRDELLNREIFTTLTEAKVLIEQ